MKKKYLGIPLLIALLGTISSARVVYANTTVAPLYAESYILVILGIIVVVAVYFGLVAIRRFHRRKKPL